MMKRFSESIYYRLLISFLIISIIPLSVMGILFYCFSSELLGRTIVEHTYSNIIKNNQNLELLFDEYNNLIDILSSDKIVKDVLLEKESIDHYYSEIYQKIYLFLSGKKTRLPIYILDKRGNKIISISRSIDAYEQSLVENWGLFRKMRESPEESILYAYHKIESTGEVFVLSLGKAVFEEDEIVGYVIVDIPRDTLIDIVKSMGNGFMLDVIMLDKHHYTVLNLKKPFTEGKYLDIETKNKIRNKSFQNTKRLTNFKEPIILSYISPKTDLTTVCFIPMDIIRRNYFQIRKLIFWVIVASLGLCLVVSFAFAKSLVNPIEILVGTMKRVEKGDLSLKVDLKRQDEIGLLGNSFNKMIEKLKEYIKNIEEKQKRIRTAEIKVLEAQINPHFLYNTLDTIKWIAKLNGVDEICNITTDLGKLLRSSISNKKEFVTVKEGIDLVKSYLNIQKIRFEDDLEVEIEIQEEILDNKIPKLILQPIVENAIVHGIENLDKRGHIKVYGRRNHDKLIFDIIDNGVGMSQKMLSDIISGGDDGEHIGLYNVSRRLKLYYGPENGINIESVEGKGTWVTVKIPIT